MKDKMGDSALRIVAVWLVVLSVAASAVVVRSSARAASIDATRSEANAVATQAASLTAQAFQEQLDLTRHAAETLLAGDIDTAVLEQALPLTSALAAGVFDSATRSIMGIAIPGYGAVTEGVDIQTVLDYFPGAEAAFQGSPIIGHAPNIIPGLTLVTLFVPYTANDGSRRVVATGVSFDESVYAGLITPGGSAFTVQVTDVDGNLLLRRGPKVPIPDVAGSVRIPGTTWVVESRATYPQIGSTLDSPWSSTGFTAIVALLIALLLGWLATRTIRSAQHVQEAYDQVAWASHQQREFTAIVAHELRTPATSASGLAAFLSERWEQLDPDKRRDLAQRVAVSTQDLARLVSDLRLSRGLTSGPVSLAPTARKTRDLVMGAVTSSEINSSDVVLDGDLEVSAIVDERFATRALSSLLSNAATHGAVPIHITVRANAYDLSIRIRDHGPGVPEDFVPLLFEPFTQARSHLRRDHRGTGLGLHLVSAIVEQMHGRVDHEHADPGAVFIVHLPMAVSQQGGDADGIVRDSPAFDDIDMDINVTNTDTPTSTPSK